MSLKNVLRLAGVYSRASRLIPKGKFRRYRENKLETYAIYALAVILGVAGGAGFGYLYMIAPDADIQALFYQAAVGFLVTMPTLCIMYSTFLAMMFQIRQSGVKASIQPLYWFPVTWVEHTAASVLSSTFGGAFWITVLLCSAMISVSIPLGLLPLGVLTSLGVLIGVFMASTTMEAFRVLQAGISGAVLKTAGKAAVWVRFFAALISFTVIYIAYFAVTQSSITVIFDSISKGQLTAWFIPYVWPGIAAYAFSKGMWAETALFAALSAIFAVLLFGVAVWMNARWGLSDAPTISVSRVYTPKEGLLNRLGVSPSESAIIKKDFRSFTRRSELRYVFIMPIVLIVATFMPIVMGRGRSLPDEGGFMRTFYFLYIAILPAAALALTLGFSLIGSEGERIWFLAVSPMSLKSFIRAKFLFTAILCTAIAVVCSIIGYVALSPSGRVAATGMVEALLMVIAVGTAALFCGIMGADFRELPRPRMIRMEWRLFGTLLGAVSGLLVLLPALAYGVVTSFGEILPQGSVDGAYLYAAWLMSGVIALAIGYIFYRISIMNAAKMMAQE
jgi:hypothetical protein